MESNEQFRKDLQTLVELFKKYADKVSDGEIDGMDPELAKQFKMMLGNYDMVKNMMPQQVPEQFREPFQQMIKSLIHQLKEEVGDVDVSENEISEEKTGNAQSIEDIQEILKKPGLSNEEIDELLDRMSSLKNKGEDQFPV